MSITVTDESATLLSGGYF